LSVVSSEPLRRVAIGVALALVYGLVAHFFTRHRLRRVLGKAPGLSTAEQEAVLLTAGRAAATAPLWLVWIVAGSVIAQGPFFGLTFAGAFALWDVLTAAWLGRWERIHGSQALRLAG
jgi:hypothetical protein